MNRKTAGKPWAPTLLGPLLVTLMLAQPAGDALAAAGSFLFVAGDVTVTPAAGGDPVRVRKGGEVQPGDTVQTGLRGVAQLRMVDGALLAVRPATELRIDEYRFEEPEQEDRSFFSLLAGAFRSITGLIGQRNSDGYQVSTSTATIGIRGSDADIGHDRVTELTGVRTYDGAHVITAKGQTGPQATLVTGPGDIALVRPGEVPTFSTEFPFTTTPPPEGGEGEQADAGEEGADGTGQAEGDDEDAGGLAAGGDEKQSLAERRRARVEEQASSLAPPPAPVVKIVTSAGSTPLDIILVAPPGTAVVGADMFVEMGMLGAGNGSAVVGGGDLALLGPQNELLFLSDPSVNGDPFVFSAAEGKLRVAGTGVVQGVGGRVASGVSWGLWQGDFVIVDSAVVRDANVGGFAYGVGSRTTSMPELAALGGTAFSYQAIGGAATNEKGARPSSFNVNASGVFLAGATLGNITVNASAAFPDGSTNWSMSASGPVRTLISDGPGLAVAASCSTCSVATGETHGQFLGARAEGLLLGISAADAGANAAVTGVAAMQRTP